MEALMGQTTPSGDPCSLAATKITVPREPRFAVPDAPLAGILRAARSTPLRVGGLHGTGATRNLAACGLESRSDSEPFEDELGQIRRATQLGEPLGSDGFVSQFERSAGRRLRAWPRGSPALGDYAGAIFRNAAFWTGCLLFGGLGRLCPSAGRFVWSRQGTSTVSAFYVQVDSFRMARKPGVIRFDQSRDP